MNSERPNPLGAALAPPLLGAGLYGEEGFLKWDQEVQLHDSQVIVAHLKQPYDRESRSFTLKSTDQRKARKFSTIRQVLSNRRSVYSLTLHSACLNHGAST